MNWRVLCDVLKVEGAMGMILIGGLIPLAAWGAIAWDVMA